MCDMLREMVQEILETMSQGSCHVKQQHIEYNLLKTLHYRE